MKRRDILRLLTVIFFILASSLVIGNVIMTPILVYHKILVHFFGWFFLGLIITLIYLKFHANYAFVQQNHPDFQKSPQIWRKTLSATFSQISQKIWNFISFTFFLIIVGLITFFLIWLNGRFIKVQAY